MDLPDPDGPMTATVSPGPDLERQPAQHRLRRHVAELHVVERDPVRVGGQFDRVRLVGDRRLGVDDLEDPDDAGAGLLADRHEAGEHPHRAGELRQVAGEREEGAERDLAVDRQPAAQQEHADEPERRDRGERGVVPGGEPEHPQPGPVQVLARGLHPLHLLLFLAEPLDDADPADRLVDDPGDLADLLLRVPAGREQLLARRRGDQPERRRDRDARSRRWFRGT